MSAPGRTQKPNLRFSAPAIREAACDIPGITTEGFIIAENLIAEKYRLTTVPALSDVMWYAGYYYSNHPGHN
jgi:hypothetical protein